MQVLPKDTGWDTLAATMMKLYDAEIQNKALNLEQLNKEILSERILGNKAGLEKRVGHPVEVKNMFQTEQPGTALESMLKSGIDPKQLPRSLAEIAALKENSSPETVGSMQAKSKLDMAQNVSDLANSPDAIQSQRNFDKWQASPESKPYLNYKTAGDALQQTIDSFWNSIEGKGPTEIAKNYHKAVAQLNDISSIYPRDLRTMLPPLNLLLRGGGGKKDEERLVQLSDKYGKLSIPYTSRFQFGTSAFKADVLRQVRETYPKATAQDLVGWHNAGTNTPEKTSGVESNAYRVNIQSQLDAIKNDSTMTNQEKAIAYDDLAKRNGIKIKLKKEGGILSWMGFTSPDLGADVSSYEGGDMPGVMIPKSKEDVAREKEEEKKRARADKAEEARMRNLSKKYKSGQ